MKAPAAAGFILTVGMAACGGQGLPEPWTSAMARDEDAVRAEAILNVNDQGSAVYGPGLDMCVSLDRTANTTRVLTRLHRRGARPWEADRCVTRGLDLVEAISGRQAIATIVTSVEMLGPGQARVQAGFLRGPLAGEGRELALEFILGRWTVASSKSTWIS